MKKLPSRFGKQVVKIISADVNKSECVSMVLQVSFVPEGQLVCPAMN